MSTPLEPPEPGPDACAAWVEKHLGDLCEAPVAASPRFRGGQEAADAALEAFDVSGYARRRNQVWPAERRGASGLSPWIRHGLLPLARVWDAVAGGPARDVAKFRDELLWQEYARHLYARVGTALAEPLRARPAAAEAWDEPWPGEMECMRRCSEELERDGWLVNQTRMWLASQWSVRAGADWREGEQRFFRHLLDGSRAANRLGWQWTIGAATGKAYGMSRGQVEKRAPAWCRACARRGDCPIEAWPEGAEPERVEAAASLARDAELARTSGPEAPEERGRPEAVWLTAESLGDADPALAAHPGLPALFVFDAPLLRRLRLSAKRLVFLAECLAELATRRTLELHRGEPAQVLAGRALAATFTPVPGWRRLAGSRPPAVTHPWPWLRRPHDGSLRSFSAWRKRLARSGRG